MPWQVRWPVWQFLRVMWVLKAGCAAGFICGYWRAGGHHAHPVLLLQRDLLLLQPGCCWLYLGDTPLSDHPSDILPLGCTLRDGFIADIKSAAETSALASVSTEPDRLTSLCMHGLANAVCMRLSNGFWFRPYTC